MAADWANGCDFRHGQPIRDPKQSPYDSIGQNLYAVSGVPLNITRGVVDWYNEKSDYNYDTLGCTAGKMCGHYTQVSKYAPLERHFTVYLILRASPR